MTKIFDKILRVIIIFLEHFSFRPKVYYVDKSLQAAYLKQPSILVCNHIHHLDGVTLCTVFRKNTIHCLAAKDRFENRHLAFLLRHTGCIPIDRKSLDTSWIHQSVRLLKQDQHNIAIFPEGQHSKTGEILPFHAGITAIAAISQAPIVLVYIDGPYSFWRKRLKMIIAPPCHLRPAQNGLTADYLQSETDYLREQMVELQQHLHTLIAKENNNS